MYVNTVSARELHKFLESKRQFSDWIKTKLERLRLIENKDFIIISQNCETIDKNGNKKVSIANEYFIALDTAKHILMMENTDRGFEVRDYFIECEKKLKTTLLPKEQCFLDIIKAQDEISTTLAIKRLDETIIRPLEQSVERMMPKEEFYDAVIQSDTTLDIGM